MHALDVDIVNPTGLHTRPGNAFVKKARMYRSEITVIKGERRGNGKSLLTLMKVGASLGDRITIVAEGPDETEAVQELVRLVMALKD